MQHVPIKRSSGFTLIELLLVLALIVALTAAGLFAYQIQLRNFRVDKTALQMQQWLQAGMAFQADCGQWPVDSVANPDILLVMTGQSPLTLTICPGLTPPNPDQKRTYMPLGIDKTHPNGPGPWMNYYDIGPYDPANQQQPPPPTVALFYVKTDIGPDNLTTENNARMIAGRLPNADVFKESVNGVPNEFVRAFVGSSPSGGGAKAGPQILDMEIVNSTKIAEHIKKPTQAMCDKFGKGLMPVLVGALSGLDAGREKEPDKGAFYGVNKGYVNMALDKNGFIDLSSLPPGVITPNSGVERDLQNPVGGKFKDYGRNQVLLISACLPKSSSLSGPQLNVTHTPSGLRY